VDTTAVTALAERLGRAVDDRRPVTLLGQTWIVREFKLSRFRGSGRYYVQAELDLMVEVEEQQKDG
jgi:hypothetical protein